MPSMALNTLACEPREGWYAKRWSGMACPKTLLHGAGKCQACQEAKVARQSRVTVRPIAVPCGQIPCGTMHVNLLGPLPTSAEGYQYQFFMVDKVIQMARSSLWRHWWSATGQVCRAVHPHVRLRQAVHFCLEGYKLTKRCRLSLLTNSALVLQVQIRGRGGIAGSQPMSSAVHITWHGAQINFGDLPPYLTYACGLAYASRHAAHPMVWLKGHTDTGCWRTPYVPSWPVHVVRSNCHGCCWAYVQSITFPVHICKKRGNMQLC